MKTTIKTIVHGIDWPALPSPVGAAKLAALFQLEQTQWWSEEKLRNYQFKQINTLLRHCVKHVPYYREILGNNIMPDGISEEQWHNVPILTRDALQQAGEKLRANALPSSHGKAQLYRTSGSTGKPVESLGTGITNFFWDVFTLRDHLWHHHELSAKLAVIRFTQDKRAKSPNGMRSEGWGRATTDVFETGSSVMLSIFTAISEQVAWLKREDPEYILTHPSILTELALYCQREGVRLPSLREVETISEALPDGLRELCHEVWGVKLIDRYSTIELGYLALQCPEHEHYHVQSEGVLLEVLDDDGKPCAPGETGRVIVTNLHNFASPLIRYELGDYAEVGEPCPCGRGLPVIKRVLGRYRNLITLPSGEQCWPKFGVGEILKVAPMRQLQMVQHSIKEVEFLLVMERPLTGEDKKKLIQMFQENLHPEMNITIREVDRIERSAGGKYEDCISKL